MQNMYINKAELYEQFMIKFCKIDLVCMVAGLAWSAAAVVILKKPQLMYIGALLFSIIIFLPGNKIIDRTWYKKMFILGLMIYIIIQLAIALVANLYNLHQLIVPFISLILILSFIFYVTILKFRAWKKLGANGITDERIKELNNQAKMSSFYVFLSAIIIIYVVISLSILRIDNRNMMILFFNSFFMLRATYSGAFLFLHG